MTAGMNNNTVNNTGNNLWKDDSSPDLSVLPSPSSVEKEELSQHEKNFFPTKADTSDHTKLTVTITASTQSSDSGEKSAEEVVESYSSTSQDSVVRIRASNFDNNVKTFDSDSDGEVFYDARDDANCARDDQEEMRQPEGNTMPKNEDTSNWNCGASELNNYTQDCHQANSTQEMILAYSDSTLETKNSAKESSYTAFDRQNTSYDDDESDIAYFLNEFHRDEMRVNKNAHRATRMVSAISVGNSDSVKHEDDAPEATQMADMLFVKNEPNDNEDEAPSVPVAPKHDGRDDIEYLAFQLDSLSSSKEEPEEEVVFLQDDNEEEEEIYEDTQIKIEEVHRDDLSLYTMLTSATPTPKIEVELRCNSNDEEVDNVIVVDAVARALRRSKKKSKSKKKPSRENSITGHLDEIKEYKPSMFCSDAMEVLLSLQLMECFQDEARALESQMSMRMETSNGESYEDSRDKDKPKVGDCNSKSIKSKDIRDDDETSFICKEIIVSQNSYTSELTVRVEGGEVPASELPVLTPLQRMKKDIYANAFVSSQDEEDQPTEEHELTPLQRMKKERGCLTPVAENPGEEIFSEEESNTEEESTDIANAESDKPESELSDFTKLLQERSMGPSDVDNVEKPDPPIGDKDSQSKSPKYQATNMDIEELDQMIDDGSFSIDEYYSNSVTGDDDDDPIRATTSSLYDGKNTITLQEQSRKKLDAIFKKLSPIKLVPSLSNSDGIPTPPQTPPQSQKNEAVSMKDMPLSVEDLSPPAIASASLEESSSSESLDGKTSKKKNKKKKKSFFALGERKQKKSTSHFGFNKIRRNAKKGYSNDWESPPPPSIQDDLPKGTMFTLAPPPFIDASAHKRDDDRENCSPDPASKDLALVPTPISADQPTPKSIMRDSSTRSTRSVHWDEEQLADKVEKGILVTYKRKKMRPIRKLEHHLVEIRTIQDNYEHEMEVDELVTGVPNLTALGYIC